MNKPMTIFIINILLLSCQLAQKPTPESVGKSRELSSVSPVIQKLEELFLRELAKQTKIPQEKIEKALVEHLLREKNYRLAGLTKKEAIALKNYSKDLPFTPKAMNWGIQNIHEAMPKIDKKILATVYKETFQKHLGGKNIFSSKFLARKNKDIFNKLSFKKSLTRLVEKIKAYDAPRTFQSLEESILIIKKRGLKDQSLLTNGKIIVESAFTISSRTGISSMGRGCSKFLEQAPKEVYAMKANIDQFRAKLIENMAYKKNNNQIIENYTKIPTHARLDQVEIDKATQLAFQKILGHSEDEARLTLNLLKREPCQLY